MPVNKLVLCKCLTRFPCVRSYGYDPLGLGKDTATVEKYRAYELIHARWAMLAAAGIIIPEGLQVGDVPTIMYPSQYMQ